MVCCCIASVQKKKKGNDFALLKGCRQNETKQKLLYTIETKCGFQSLNYLLYLFTEAPQCIMIFTLNSNLTFEEI